MVRVIDNVHSISHSISLVWMAAMLVFVKIPVNNTLVEVIITDLGIDGTLFPIALHRLLFRIGWVSDKPLVTLGLSQ